LADAIKLLDATVKIPPTGKPPSEKPPVTPEQPPGESTSTSGQPVPAAAGGKPILPNAALAELPRNSLTRDAKLISDIVLGEPFRSKGFGGLDVKTQGIVKDAMLRMSDHPKVFDSIIKLVPVDVVNSLRTGKLSTKTLLKNQSMLQNALTAVSGIENSIPSRIDESAPPVGFVADSAAKNSNGSGPDVAVNSGKSISTSGADIISSHKENIPPKESLSTPKTEKPGTAIPPEGMSLNPVEHGFDSVEQFQSDFEKLSIKEDADTYAETKDEFLKRKHCQMLAQTPIKRAMRKKQ